MPEVSTLDSDPQKKTATETPKKGAKADKKVSYRIPRIIVLTLSGGIALFLLGFIIYIAQDIPPLSEIENPSSSLSTQVISADGVVLDNFYANENRVNVRLNQISHYVIDALIATEDARFYQHSGVDYLSIPALIKRNLTGTTSGGSTITMQLSRNLFNQVSRDRTIIRKIKEVIVSTILERNFTKEEIITAYLNTVNIYGNAYGIEMAAQRLFAKPARDLKVEEAAVLVGMLKGQGVFDPINKPEKVVSRRNLVINQMVKYGFLDSTKVDIDSVKAIPLTPAKQVPEHLKGIARHFRQVVREYVAKWCKEHKKADGSHYNLYTDGLKIYTTLDSRMQRHAESAASEHLSELQVQFDNHIKGQEPYKDDPKILTDNRRWSERYRQAKLAGKDADAIEEEFNTAIPMTLFSWEGDIDTVMSPMDSIKYYSRFLETGMVSINPLNGEVKSWVGGLDFRYFKFDHVQKGKRQAGSIFKPFVYTVAINAGYSPCHRELNQPVTFDNVDGEGTKWQPKNSDGKFGGMMTLREGLAKSVNLITARLMKKINPPAVVKIARDMGIKSQLEAVPSLCLGTSDVTVLELTGAYSTFANKGQWIEPHYIARIEDRNGEILDEFPVQSRTVLDQTRAHMMVELLKGVVDEPGGTAARLRYQYKFRNEIAGKTGTTQEHSDGWFLGVTPNLVTGIWVGCSDRRMHFKSIKLGQGANMALPIWALYMQRLYEDEAVGLPQERFPRPGGFSSSFVCDDLDDALDDAARKKGGTGNSDDVEDF